jgi:prevent-host-death family protein
MTEVSIRDLRNHGGDIVDRVAQGEQVTITHAGNAVAELRPVSAPPLSGSQLSDAKENPEPMTVPTKRDTLADLDTLAHQAVGDAVGQADPARLHDVGRDTDGLP